MKGDIFSVKNVFARRALLIMAIVPAVGVYVFMEVLELLAKTVYKTVATFKEAWEGE